MAFDSDTAVAPDHRIALLDGHFYEVYWRTFLWTWGGISGVLLVLCLAMPPMLIVVGLGILMSIPIGVAVGVLAFLPCWLIWKAVLRLLLWAELREVWVLGCAGAAVGFIGSGALSVLFWLWEDDPSGLATIPVAAVVGAWVGKGLVKPLEGKT